MLISSLRRIVSIVVCVVLIGFTNITFSASSCLEGSEAFINEYIGKISLEGYVHENSLTNLLINKQETTDQRKGLVYHFCDTLLGTRQDDTNMEHACFSYDSFTYDPRQSLFMYSLCVNTEEKNGDLKTFPERKWKEKFVVEGSDFRLQDYIEDDLDLNEVRGIPSQDLIDGGVAEEECNPRLSMQGCEFSYVIPELFANVMNAYTNIKLATTYGYKYILKDASPEQKKQYVSDAIQDFSQAYFSPPPLPKQSPSDNECGEAGMTYISKTSEEGHAVHCTHPKTYNMVEETILSATALVEKVDWLKADEIILQLCKEQPDNLMACAFSSKGHYFGDSDWKEYQNLYLNELMFFRLFADYYTNQLLDKVTYNSNTIGSISAAAKRNQEEYIAMQQEIQLHTQAAYQSNRQLSQLYVSYPLHVALMAYKEDLLLHKPSLANLYVPLHQLNSLLRNVQACQS